MVGECQKCKGKQHGWLLSQMRGKAVWLVTVTDAWKSSAVGDFDVWETWFSDLFLADHVLQVLRPLLYVQIIG